MCMEVMQQMNTFIPLGEGFYRQLFSSTANQPLTEAQLPQPSEPQGNDEASPAAESAGCSVCVFFCSECVRLRADSGHGLVGLLGAEPESDLQGVHTDGELAADALKARLGAALQGSASLLDDSHIQTRLSRHLQCVFDPVLVPNREVKANWEFCCLPTFTSAICQPGNTDALVK